MPRDLPVEAGLRDLARRFATAERRIRSLVAQVPNGNRRRLLIEALHTLYALRDDALFAGLSVERAYRLAAVAMSNLTGRPATEGTRVEALGRSLQARLIEGIARAEAGSQNAFATARPEGIEQAEREAVGARTNRDGAVVLLGAEAAMLTRTLGRRAVSRVPRDMGIETVVITGGDCPICEPLQGEHPATLEPPFHPHCDCIATPLGYTLSAHLDAMGSATL